jgi:ElaB/YqjD/DUF883 family membrane-anchored ribosome-binding protein
MAEEPEVIREQMERTRASLSEKLKALEQHVAGAVQGATDAVAETVGTVKETVQATVSTVKENVQATAKTVQEAFDISLQFQRRPWLMLGGSMLVGYMAGTMLQRRRAPRVQSTAAAVCAGPIAGKHHEASQAHTSEPEHGTFHEAGWMDKLSAAVEPELAKLKGLAIGATMGVLRDMVAKSVRGEMGGKLRGIIDDATERLGGRPIEQPILPMEESKASYGPSCTAGIG